MTKDDLKALKKTVTLATDRIEDLMSWGGGGMTVNELNDAVSKAQEILDTASLLVYGVRYYPGECWDYVCRTPDEIQRYIHWKAEARMENVQTIEIDTTNNEVRYEYYPVWMPDHVSVEEKEGWMETHTVTLVPLYSLPKEKPDSFF